VAWMVKPVALDDILLEVVAENSDVPRKNVLDSLYEETVHVVVVALAEGRKGRNIP
jgi:hypothetical protein